MVRFMYSQLIQNNFTSAKNLNTTEIIKQNK